MFEKLLEKGKKIVVNPQNSVLSAASIVMIMVFASRILGLIRQRVLADFFTPSELSLFFAAFRLPDLIFEILVFGTFSSAFIPVFTKALKKGEGDAWKIAGKVVNIGLLIFGISAIIFSIFAEAIYGVVAPGFDKEEVAEIAGIARILFAAQGFFVVSYVLTGVLESLRRFLIPALAPIFYNLGIILGIVFLTPTFGLRAPAIGVVIGAISHFLIQFPFARKLGFRFEWGLTPNEGVKKIGHLALPRVVDLSFDQIGKTVELFLASLISKASYTYFTFANTLQLLPVSLFGTSLAKAALPTLSRQEGDPVAFRKTLTTTISQAIFFTVPVSALLIVLRIPIVRLIYGTDIFDWQATVETGYVLSAFALGIVFQTLLAILTRSFFALHDSKTPVAVSMGGLFLLVLGDFVLVRGFSLPVWALAASFSFSVFLETIALFYLINKKVGQIITRGLVWGATKIVTASLWSGFVVYFFLKIFDRSVWVKRLSFLGKIEATQYIPFESFVLDTRHTVNLFILTFLVSLLGILVYLVLAIILRTSEVFVFFGFVRRIFRRELAPIPQKETETVSPPPESSRS